MTAVLAPHQYRGLFRRGLSSKSVRWGGEGNGYHTGAGTTPAPPVPRPVRHRSASTVCFRRGRNRDVHGRASTTPVPRSKSHGDTAAKGRYRPWSHSSVSTTPVRSVRGYGSVPKRPPVSDRRAGVETADPCVTRGRERRVPATGSYRHDTRGAGQGRGGSRPSRQRSLLPCHALRLRARSEDGPILLRLAVTFPTGACLRATPSSRSRHRETGAHQKAGRMIRCQRPTHSARPRHRARPPPRPPSSARDARGEDRVARPPGRHSSLSVSRGESHGLGSGRDCFDGGAARRHLMVRYRTSTSTSAAPP